MNLIIIIFLSLSWLCLGHGWQMLPHFAPRCPALLKASNRKLPDFVFLPPEFKIYSEEELNQMTNEDLLNVYATRKIEQLMLLVVFNFVKTAKEAEPDTAIIHQLRIEQFDQTADHIELAIKIVYWKGYFLCNDQCMKHIRQCCQNKQQIQFTKSAFRSACAGWGSSPEDLCRILNTSLSLIDFRDKMIMLLEQWPKLLEAIQPLRSSSYPPPFVAVNDNDDDDDDDVKKPYDDEKRGQPTVIS